MFSIFILPTHVHIFTTSSYSKDILIFCKNLIFSPFKVKHAERYGCIGMILFSDPQQYANGGNLTHFYPENWWLPPTGVQRGNVRSESSGDPLTPAYPSIGNYYSLCFKICQGLPKLYSLL